MLKMFDGAMGTQLQNMGIADKPCPEYASVIKPGLVTQIHRSYVDAGADIIETNTFGANRLKLANYGLENQVEKIITASVKAARMATVNGTLVAGSVGPTGKLIVPLGESSFDEIASSYEEQIKYLVAAGVDYVLIETILDIQEMRAAVLAAKAVSNTPVIAQLTFEENGRTVTGTSVESAAAILEPLGASVIGMNCSLGPEQLLPLVKKLAENTSLPISVQPNAGLPHLVGNKTVFPLSPEEMAGWVPKLVDAGASFIGGCCGTTPEHIMRMKEKLTICKEAVRKPLPFGVRLASRSRSVWLGTGHDTVLIGERINPTGRKVLAEELKQGSLITLKKDALDQVENGAGVLDVNIGVPGLDQKELMKKVVTELSAIVDVPFSIDSTQPEVIEEGLKNFPGRALINSVSGDKPAQDKILTLAKKYGAAVIVLPLAGRELPKTAEDKLKIAKEIVAAAKKAGLSDSDMLLDGLVLTAATDGNAPGETLKTLRLYKEEFGYPTTMGLSNVSFGLPQRELINTAFFLMSLANGLDAPIINPMAKNIKEMLAAAKVINGQDAQGIKFSQDYSAAGPQDSIKPDEGDKIMQLKKAVMRGEKELAGELCVTIYKEGSSVGDITENALTAAMEEIGKDFAIGKAFLPQVMLSAEAMRTAFDSLKQFTDAASDKKGKVVLATVEGDIHDLGKNIVSALLNNSGFEIIDLGKDVPADKLLECVKKEKPDIVGLCALMTTTLGAMQECIGKLHDEKYAGGIMVGGAVLTAEYAEHIGADMYAKDGVRATTLAKEWMEKIYKSFSCMTS